jgi:hypothetical protein
MAAEDQFLLLPSLASLPSTTHLGSSSSVIGLIIIGCINTGDRAAPLDTTLQLIINTEVYTVVMLLLG